MYSKTKTNKKLHGYMAGKNRVLLVLRLHTAGVSHFTASTQLHSWNYYASEVTKPEPTPHKKPKYLRHLQRKPPRNNEKSINKYIHNGPAWSRAHRTSGRTCKPTARYKQSYSARTGIDSLGHSNPWLQLLSLFAHSQLRKCHLWRPHDEPAQ